jgi:antitoxin (DNA-binding transcriptional repressor) of toxin-antitoxin stability system
VGPIVIQVNLHEAKAKLSAYLDAVLRGERVVMAQRTIPVAELRLIPPSVATERPIGQGPREPGYDLPDTFWEPLPGQLAAAFGGNNACQGGDPAQATANSWI